MRPNKILHNGKSQGASGKMNKFFLDKREIKVPGCWNELSARQLLAVIKILQAGIPEKEAKLLLLPVLIEIPAKVRYKWQKLNIEQIDEMLLFTDFIFGENELTENKLPKIGKLYGPANIFESICFLEFIQADTALMNFQNSKKQAYLDRLCAILYRPKIKNLDRKNPDWRGDIREKYSDYNLPERTKTTAKWKPEHKIAALLWYTACRLKLSEKYSDLFGKGGKADNFGWPGILRRLAGDLTKMEAVAYERLDLVLFDLQIRAADYKEAEKRMKQ